MATGHRQPHTSHKPHTSLTQATHSHGAALAHHAPHLLAQYHGREHRQQPPPSPSQVSVAGRPLSDSSDPLDSIEVDGSIQGAEGEENEEEESMGAALWVGGGLALLAVALPVVL